MKERLCKNYKEGKIVRLGGQRIKIDSVVTNKENFMAILSTEGCPIRESLEILAVTGEGSGRPRSAYCLECSQSLKFILVKLD
jgi:hypothetical protein